MPEYHHLIGSEDVRTGGASMLRAAEEMNRVANNLEQTLLQHQRFMDDWLARYEAAMERGVEVKPYYPKCGGMT